MDVGRLFLEAIDPGFIVPSLANHDAQRAHWRLPVSFFDWCRDRNSTNLDRMKAWLKHAFAIDSGEVVPSQEQSALIDRLAKEIVRRRLTTPALAFLEMSRPLGFFGSQALHFFAPMISAITDSRGHEHFAKFLEQRGAIDVLCDRIETQQRESEGVHRADANSVSSSDQRRKSNPQ